jgi:hypothetical protein
MVAFMPAAGEFFASVGTDFGEVQLDFPGYHLFRHSDDRNAAQETPGCVHVGWPLGSRNRPRPAQAALSGGSNRRDFGAQTVVAAPAAFAAGAAIRIARTPATIW